MIEGAKPSEEIFRDGETIREMNGIIYEWIDGRLQIHARTPDGWREVQLTLRSFGPAIGYMKKNTMVMRRVDVGYTVVTRRGVGSSKRNWGEWLASQK